MLKLVGKSCSNAVFSMHRLGTSSTRCGASRSACGQQPQHLRASAMQAHS